MEIKINNFKTNIFFYLVLFFSIHVTSNQTELKVSKIEDQLISLEIQNPIEGIIFDLSKKVDKSNKVISIDNKQTFKLLEEIHTLPLESQIVLGDGEYIRIKGRDNRTLLHNGSILIKFVSIPNLDDFVSNYDLILTNELTDINVIGFKVKNINLLYPVISKLRGDKDIIAIQLDTLDPSIKSK